MELVPGIQASNWLDHHRMSNCVNPKRTMVSWALVGGLESYLIQASMVKLPVPRSSTDELGTRT